jgi:hypothetical protein
MNEYGAVGVRRSCRRMSEKPRRSVVILLKKSLEMRMRMVFRNFTAILAHRFDSCGHRTHCQVYGVNFITSL